MADLDLAPATTIDLGRLRAGFAAVRRPALGLALAVGVAAAALVAARPTPVVVEARWLVEPARAERVAADEDRVLAAQIGLMRTDAFLRRAAVRAAALADGGDRAAMERAAQDLARLQASFAATRLDRSRILVLTTTAEAAGDATRLLDAVHAVWAGDLADARARAESEVDRRFAADVEAARRRLDAAEAAAAAPPPAEPVASSDVEALRGEKIAAETKLKQLEEMAGEGEKGAERAVDVAATPGLAKLREKRGLLRARLAELSITYLANHPLMKQANADLDDLRREIRAELPRAIAALETGLADLDRRLVEAAAETTASLPPSVPDTAALRAALDDVLARRDAARREAGDRVGVRIRPLGGPTVEETGGWAAPTLAGFGSAAVAFLAAAFALSRRRPRVAAAAPVAAAADLVAVPVVEPPADAAPEAGRGEAADPVAPVDDLAGRRIRRRVDEAFSVALADAAAIGAEIRRELGQAARIVVVSVGEAALACGAARALVAVGDDRTGLVDLSGCDDPAFAGVSDLLDGGIAFSEALRRDPEIAAWTIGSGSRPLADLELADPAFEAVIEACAVEHGGLVIAAGRLEAGEGQTALFVGADAIVLAEADPDDPRVARVRDAFLDAGRPAWVLAAGRAASPDPRAGEAVETATPLPSWADAA